MDKKDELLAKTRPCPFCGGLDLAISEVMYAEGTDEFFIECKRDECEAYGPSASDPEGALDRWNDRKL